MKKNNQLPILLAFLAVTGGAAYWKYSHRAGVIGKVPAEVGTDVLKNFKPADIASITLKDSKGEVTIEQKDGKWIAPARDGFPVSQETLTTLVKEAFEMKIGESQRAGASQLGTIKLKSPADGAPEAETGTLVTFKDSSGKVIASVIAGKVMTIDGNAPAAFSMSPQGPKTQYLKVDGMGDTVVKAREGFSSLSTDVKTWLDKAQFIKVSDIKDVAVTGSTPEETWKIHRDSTGGELKLDAPAAGEEFDAAKAAGVGSIFSFVQFADVAPAADAAKAALDKPVRTAVINTFDGYTWTVKVGAAEADNHYLAYSVDAKFPETRPAPAPKADGKPAETDEEKKTADEAFAKALEEKKKKLAEQQATAQNRIFLVTKSSLEPILKKRADYQKDKNAAPGAPGLGGAGGPGLPPGLNLPGGAGLPSGVSVTTPPIEVKAPEPTPAPKPIEAVTPPITIDPAAAPKPAEAPKTEEPKPAAPPAPAPAPEAPKPEAPKPAEAAPVPAPAPTPTPEAPKAEPTPPPAAPAPAPEAPKAEAPAPAPASPAAPPPAEEKK